ncbi:MAG TPA: hypothetical protein VH594_16655 [Trebonia sp.]|jgi:NADPH:quinone reductase-like Zn-dependent oxidoreductase
MEKEQLTEVVLPGVVEPEGLLLRTGPVPAPAAGQAVIRMEAAGVSFAEQQMRLAESHTVAGKIVLSP